MTAPICEHCHGTGFVLNQKSIGKEFRTRRLSARVGLRQLAKAIKVHPAHLSRLERGLAIWKPELMRKIDSALS